MILILSSTVPPACADREPSERLLPDVFGNLDTGRITTGILYDRVVPFSHVEDYDASPASRPISLKQWRQVYFEMYRASLAEPAGPDLGTLLEQGRRAEAEGVIPIAFLDIEYTRIRATALQDGSLLIEEGQLVEGSGDPYVEARVFAVAALRDYTYRGTRVVFSLGPDWYISNTGEVPQRIEADFDDGLGFCSVRLGQSHRVSYSTAGPKTVRITAYSSDGSVLHGGFAFDVRTLEAPAPDDTLAITASIPYNGDYGTGEAYLYLSDSHVELTDPVIVVEGFDIDNNMNWEELYQYLNQEGMVESLRSDGYDLVALNFTDATDFIQRNTYVLVELIEEVNAAIDPGTDIAIVGASMGGVIGRLSLAYMETNGLDHNARTFVSFDSPQNGANIPLGLQYWVDFFSEDSEDAAYMRDRLNTPAARQLLVYHFTDPPGTTGESDPLRTGLMADLAAVGDYPQDLRKVAVSNGSGLMADQGFAAGDQVILYEYSSLLVDIVGNVWAVPDSAEQMIFDGAMDLIWPFPDKFMTVYVSGTRPYDNAPGGFRASMAQMDSVEAPYGDIIALHDNHCFVPTVSALALDTDDLFYDVAGAGDLMSHTPFDTVYYPAANEEHMTITAESATWFLTEIQRDVAAVSGGPARPPEVLALYQNSPNPFCRVTTINYSAGVSERLCITIYDTRGRTVATLLDEPVGAGRGQVTWSGRDEHGREVASGIYFCRLTADGQSRVRPIVLLR